MAFITRLAAAVAGTRVAAAAGKYGIVGTAAGLVVTSAILRWPGKALLLGTIYAVSKVQVSRKQNLVLLEDHSAEPAKPVEPSPLRVPEATL